MKNRVAPEIEEAVVALAIEQPAWRQVRVANDVLRRGMTVSPFGVRSIWERHDLKTIQHRLKALQAPLIAVEAKIAALVRCAAMIAAGPS